MVVVYRYLLKVMATYYVGRKLPLHPHSCSGRDDMGLELRLDPALWSQTERRDLPCSPPMETFARTLECDFGVETILV
jgi:hypothetical protein